MWMQKVRKAIPYDTDDVLNAMGLEKRRSGVEIALTSIMLVGLGTAVGVGIGLMLAPKPGKELRADLRKKLKTAQAKADGVLPKLKEGLEQLQAAD